MFRVLLPTFKPDNNLIYCKTGLTWVVACKQALLFGRAKRVSRECASEWRSREGLARGGGGRGGVGSAPHSRILARLAQTGELARRLCG